MTASQRAFHVALAVIGVAVLLLLAWEGIHALLTVFAGAVVGVALRALKEPVMRWTHLPRGPALGLVVLLGLAAVVGAVAGLVPPLGQQGQALLEEIPTLTEELQTSLGQLGIGAGVLQKFDPQQLLEPKVMFGLFSSAASALSATVLTVVIGVYLAAEPDLYRRGLLRMVSMHRRERAAYVLGRLDHTLRWWFVGQFLSMAILGVLTTLGLWLFGVPYALVFGVLTALMTFVPILGPILAAIPTIAVAAMQGSMVALYVALYYLALQSLEGYVLTPMIHRKVISLPPVLILATQMVLFTLVGVVGIVLAMPLVTCIVVLVQTLYVEDVLGDSMDHADPFAESDR